MAAAKASRNAVAGLRGRMSWVANAADYSLVIIMTVRRVMTGTMGETVML